MHKQRLKRKTLTAAALDVELAAAEEDAALPVAALLDASVAPVAAMRASRSAAVVQVMLVPAELTRGKAAQLHNERETLSDTCERMGTYIKPPPHCWRTNLPFTHCANLLSMHASSPV